MSVCRSWRVVLGAVLTALLLTASRVHAQSIVDARRVEFTPSADHNTALNASGAPMVESYSIDVFVAGGQWPVATANLGKPTPDPDGKIRLDFVSLLPVTLQTGVTYEAVVEAIGPGGRSGGTRTNTFSFGGVACTFSVTPPASSFAAAGGTGTSTVATAGGCVWNATSSASWITVTSGASGSGSGTVGFSVAANSSTAPRSATLTIAATPFMVTQAGATCSYSISPANQSFTAAGGTSSSAVTAGAGCAWTASSNASWITVTSGASGSGPGSTSFTVAANTAITSRSGTLTIAGATFTVTQANASCSYSISSTSQSFSAAGGSGGTSVSATSGCAWSATSNASWITVTSGATGSGPGSAGFSVAANTSTTSRSGTLTIAGTTFSVTQAGAACSYSTSPTSQTFSSQGGTGSSTVSAGAGCAWTASSNAPWITMIAGSSGSGSGSATFTVAAYTGTTTRTGTMTIAGSTFTVTQAAPSACTFSMLSTSQAFTADGGFGSTTVTAPAACAWEAVSNVSWVAVVNAGPGAGTGNVSFIVATNTFGPSRVGTLSIADKTFTVTQGAVGCAYSVTPASQTFGGEGGAGSSAVTTGAGCGWGAVSNVPWISITSGTSGSGPGTVGFNVAPNTGAGSRIGMVTIGFTTVTITQAAPSSCVTSISPTSSSFTSDGGFGNSVVTSASTCAWSAVSNVHWIAVINAGPGSGNGTVSFIVATNGTGASRTGTVTIAGTAFSVTQTASASCSYSVTPTGVSVKYTAATVSFRVSTQSGCPWSSSGAPQWLTVVGGGPGSGSVTFNISENTTTSPRSATVTIAGQSVPVSQSGRLTTPANLRVVR